MEFSTQWNTHLINYSVSEFVAAARRAHDLGFQTIWLNDNVRYRNIFTVLTAIAAQVPIKVGPLPSCPTFTTPLPWHAQSPHFRMFPGA